MESNEYLNFAKEMCSEAGKIMKKYFYQDSGISYKGDRTIVTLADKEINHILLDNLYSAVKGQGAYCNNKKITVNDFTLEDERSIGHFDMWPAAEYNDIPVMNELYKKTYFVGIGSIIRASVCVASGDFTCCIFPGTKGKNCDIAAVKVIVEEAGGKVTDLFGNEQRYDEPINGALISNGVVHDELIKSAKANIKQRL